MQSISERRLSPREAEGSQMFPRQTKSTTTGWAGEVASVLAITRCAGVWKGERLRSGLGGKAMGLRAERRKRVTRR